MATNDLHRGVDVKPVEKRWPMLKVLAALMIGLLAFAPRVRAQRDPAWTAPFPPFRIAANLYYVGSRDLASYLVTTPHGHILINSTLEENVPLIRASVERLGFRFGDIRILLISHAHYDHDAGSALIKQMTGARYMVMDADVPVVESGGAADFLFGDSLAYRYPPIKVDRVLHDGDKVRLGGVFACRRCCGDLQPHDRPAV